MSVHQSPTTLALARLTTVAEQRRRPRRERDGRSLVSMQRAFAREERTAFKGLERRRSLRRGGDVAERVASLEQA